MAVSGMDLVAPSGEIDKSLFPSDSEMELMERLESYLTEAEGKKIGVSDAGKKAWAYYRAFRAVFIRLSSTPSARFDDQGDLKYSDAQINNFNNLAEKYLAEWEMIITAEVETGFGPTGSVKNKFTW